MSKELKEEGVRHLIVCQLFKIWLLLQRLIYALNLYLVSNLNFALHILLTLPMLLENSHCSILLQNCAIDQSFRFVFGKILDGRGGWTVLDCRDSSVFASFYDRERLRDWGIDLRMRVVLLLLVIYQRRLISWQGVVISASSIRFN